MYIRYFCEAHAEKIVRNEHHAAAAWRQMVTTATAASQGLDVKPLEQRLGSAVDIACLRLSHAVNDYFRVDHILHPAALFVEWCVEHYQFEPARTHLDFVESNTVALNKHDQQQIKRFVQQQRSTIDQAERHWFNHHAHAIQFIDGKCTAQRTH